MHACQCAVLASVQRYVRGTRHIHDCSVQKPGANHLECTQAPLQPLPGTRVRVASLSHVAYLRRMGARETYDWGVLARLLPLASVARRWFSQR